MFSRILHFLAQFDTEKTSWMPSFGPIQNLGKLFVVVKSEIILMRILMKMSMMIMLIMMMWVMFRKTKQMEVALHRIQKIFPSGWTGLRKLVLPEHLAMLIIKMMIFVMIIMTMMHWWWWWQNMRGKGKGSWLSLVQRFPLFTRHLLHVHYNVHFVQRTSWMFRQFYCSVYCTLLICSEAVQNQCTARSSYSALQCVSLHYNALSEDSPVNCSAMQSSHPAHCTAAHPVQ